MSEVPSQLHTERLILRRPRVTDAEAIFCGWANNPVATRCMSWPRHQSLAATIDFLRFSESEWASWPAGPIVIELRDTGQLIGSTGFGFRNTTEAEVGYILDVDFWGFGYATEALGTVVELAPRLGLDRLTASIHPANTASARVLEKCGFALERQMSSVVTFPNLPPGETVEALPYSRVVG